MATYNVNTKQDKDSHAVRTALTIDFTGATPEILQEIATSAIVIKWQGQVRKNGIPATASIKAIDYRPGTRLTPQPLTFDQLADRITTMTPEQHGELLRRLLDSKSGAELNKMLADGSQVESETETEATE